MEESGRLSAGREADVTGEDRFTGCLGARVESGDRRSEASAKHAFTAFDDLRPGRLADPGGVEHGGNLVAIVPASAQVAAQRHADVIRGWLRILLKQRDTRHDHSGR